MTRSIDLRSDTVTKPSLEMRRAMANAEVADDVLDQDPTVVRLQDRTADLLGKESAIFMPSGTMANQIAIRLHCRPGDEFICEADCHVYNYEQGAFAQLSGVVARTVTGKHGVLELEQLEGTVRPDNEHFVRTKMVNIENTHNRGGGKIQPLENVREICTWAKENSLTTHLDGARLFNAAVASKVDAKILSEPFDTVSVCFSKGLGAPIGSALAGSEEKIRIARRHRKLFGGGTRQVGIIAAGALYGLENNIQRLADDHTHAALLADKIEKIEELSLVSRPETNMLLIDVDRSLGMASILVECLAKKNVLVLAFAPRRIRVVTHLDIRREDIDVACQAFSDSVAMLR